ncbi:LytTR family DNA-binding domain-containing protein [Glacieibacterium frigidum]|uniref:LytTR family DNA-binding domain-containing protein n=1 Tax=Glacieibacterium frigidum TaxID=2593303 RepID=UPI001A9C9F8D|nr:LytTR family DNA-binding domain-containing protein [Glacieibacterium frigidum]
MVIATVAGGFMALIGALGSGQVPLLPRLAYWLAVMWSGAALGHGVSVGMRNWGRLQAWPLVEGALIALVIALPLTTIVIVANHLAFGGGFPSPAGMAGAFLTVLLISGLITALNYTTTPPVVPLPSAQAEAPPPPPRFLDRLPLRLRHARLLAIEAEDHYLRVHTDAGSDLVLLRMVDAIAELDGLAGARTHRSWWVARDAVVSVDSGGGRTTLTLAGGLAVPVSRGARPELAAQGWFA